MKKYFIKCVFFSMMMGLSDLGLAQMNENMKAETVSVCLDETHHCAMREIEDWNFLNSFYLTSGGQIGVATDGNFIYTCSWQTNPMGGYSFYKYDLLGHFLEGFNIDGAVGILDLAFDGNHFYGSNKTNYLYEMDFNNKTLVNEISTTCNQIWFCAYDPTNDGFWVGTSALKLINRSGQTIKSVQSGIAPSGAAYFKDSADKEHLYLFSQGVNNDQSLVHDYNITTNTMNPNPVFDFEVMPGYNLSQGPEAGGAFIGEYNGKMAFFGNIQYHNTNQVGIYEIDAPTPSSDYATVILTAGNIWNDGTGYQMLLDADANTYGTYIPTSGGLTNSGDAGPEVYAQFEYKIPENADGSCTTQNVVFNSSKSILIPTGVYDWCITNPTPNDRIWIASDNGTIGGRQNDFSFEGGKIYEFEVKRFGANDGVDLTVTNMPSGPFAIIADANPSNGGNLTGAGTYDGGTICTLTATPNPGYSFVSWNKNGINVSNDRVYSFAVTENATYVAHFATIIPAYTIEVSADPSEGGMVVGGGAFGQGATCTLAATPNKDYRFVNWTKNGIEVSTDRVFSFTVTEDAAFVAHFETIVNNCHINVSANPTEGGSVSGGGTYSQGSTCTLSAIANNGYSFVNWTKNNSIVSTELDFSFTVTEDADYVAHFSLLPVSFSINVEANPAIGGTVSGGGTFVSGLSCTVIASANEGYVFSNWTENGVVVSQETGYTFLVDRNRRLTANFNANPYYIISASCSANGSISPQGDIQVLAGSNQTFTILPDFGCVINKVLVDGVDLGPINTYTFSNVGANHTIYAMFSGWAVDESSTLGLLLYPNPVKDYLTVEGDGITQIQLFDMLGNKICDWNVNDGKGEFYLQDIPNGIYVVAATLENGRKCYQNILVSKH